METSERLYRSKINKVIGGVAAGLANYFNIDIALARVAFVLLAFFGGGGVLIYIVLWVVMPSDESINFNSQNNANSSNENDVYQQTDNNPTEFTANKIAKKSNTGLVTGSILIFLGLIFLADKIMPWYNIADLWPLVLVIAGVLMIKPNIFKQSKKQNHEI